MQDLRKAAVVIASHGEELQGGEGTGVWNSMEVT